MTLKEMLKSALKKKRLGVCLSDQEKEDLTDKLLAYAAIRFQKSADLEVETQFVKALKKEKKSRTDVMVEKNEAVKKEISDIMDEYHMKSAENGFIRVYTRDVVGKLELIDEKKVPDSFWNSPSKVDLKKTASVLKEIEKTEKIAFWGTGRKVPVVGIKGTGYIPGVELPYPLPLPSFDHAIEIAEAKKEVSPKEKALALALIKQQMDTELATVDGYYATAISRRETSIQKHKKEIQDIDDMLAAGLDALDLKSLESGTLKLSVTMKAAAPVIFSQDYLPDGCMQTDKKIDTIRLRSYIHENVAADEKGIRETEFARMLPAKALIMS